MNSYKKTYQVPHVNRVELDNEISLILASASMPMDDPEAFGMSFTETTFLSTDPFNPGKV